MSTPRPTVSVVIPTWNRQDLVRDCLASLAEQTCVPDEIVVVDDGSTDGTADIVAAEFPAVHLVALPENGGFARAVNAGLRAATGDWIFLLNNDMTLDPACIVRMLECAETTGADMIAPLVLWRDDPATIYSAGDLIAQGGRPVACGFRAPREGFTMPDEIFGVSGGAGMFRRDVFDRVGLLDESFGAYFEDADLCFRARLAGFTAALAPAAIAYHIGSASIAGKTWWRSQQCFKNHALLVIKNYPAPFLRRHGRALIAEHFHQKRQCFRALRTEFGALFASWMTITTWCRILGALPSVLAERKIIQSARTISDEELTRLLALGRDAG